MTGPLPPSTKGSGVPGFNGSSNGRSTGGADPLQTLGSVCFAAVRASAMPFYSDMVK